MILALLQSFGQELRQSIKIVAQVSLCKFTLIFWFVRHFFVLVSLFCPWSGGVAEAEREKDISLGCFQPLSSRIFFIKTRPGTDDIPDSDEASPDYKTGSIHLSPSTNYFHRHKHADKPVHISQRRHCQSHGHIHPC